MLFEGDVINNNYIVGKRIGNGGTGEVYLGWHKGLRKKIVIKSIKSEYIDKVQVDKEAAILKNLHHQFLPQVYDYIQKDGQVLTIIDYIDGNAMTDYIRQQVRFDQTHIIRWLKQLLQAIDYLHSQTSPIIHRDIKPGNIMITRDGDICLIDFNISVDKRNDDASTARTREFCAPEQARRAALASQGRPYQHIKVDERSDIFSLGASLYQLMTGRRAVELINNNLPLWNGDEIYSELLRNTISKALNINPADRFQSAAEMLADVNGYVGKDRETQKLRRNQLILNIVSLVLVAAGSLMIYFGLQNKVTEAFVSEYDAVADKAEEHSDYQNTIDGAIDLLNDKTYSGVLKKEAGYKANLCYIVANCFFEQDDYEQSLKYYKDAVDTGEAESDCYRDYAISTARNGDTKAARAILDSNKRLMNEPDVALVNAEIAYAGQEYTECVECSGEILNGKLDDELFVRTNIIKSRAEIALKQWTSAINTLTNAYNEAYSKRTGSSQRRLLRELGNSYVKTISSVDEEDELYEQLLDNACVCYDQILKDETYTTIDDYLNTSKILTYKSQHMEAQNLLLGVRKRFAGDYRINMNLALIELQKIQELDEDLRDYVQFDEFYHAAQDEYADRLNDGRSDPDMDILIQHHEDLIDGGWLNK